MNFRVYKRNPGHWDISIQDYGRIFRIRGAPSKYIVYDEREGELNLHNNAIEFKTVSACMTYICDELMFELVMAEGQEPKIIEAWNL